MQQSSNIIRIQPKEAPTYLASKWFHFDLLVEVEELESLFASFGDFYMFSTLGVAAPGAHLLEKKAFLEAYGRYLDELKQGKVVVDGDYRFFFTACLTKTLNAIRAIDIGNNKEIITPYEPVLQMQMHRFSFSYSEMKFHSMAFGDKCISWGLRLSYPQLYQYPETRKVEDALDEERFVNAKLYSSIRPWLRAHTIPTPFVIDGKRVNDPMRLGKKCLPWIQHHAEMQIRGLNIYGAACTS